MGSFTSRSGKEGEALSNREQELIRKELERILASPVFHGSRRCSGLLKFVVEETLAGKSDPELKERSIGIAVFDRAASYDTSDDSIVRVTAGEVRKRLAQYYVGAGQDSAVRIELPVGSYRTFFVRKEEPAPLSTVLAPPAAPTSTPASRASMDDLDGDPRWQLIQRICASAAFQKAGRLRELLLYISERSLHGLGDELNEQHIGRAVFGKALDYSPLDDSSVRVHARQLRLKLHEYFAGPGIDDSVAVEIPKGSYAPVFRERSRDVSSPEQPPAPATPLLSRTVLLWTSAVLALTTIILGALLLTGAPRTAPANPLPPWPLSLVLDGQRQTQIVIADANYGMLRLLGGRPISLSEYLSPEFLQTHLPPPSSGANEQALFSYISKSLLTSYADASVVRAVAAASGAYRDRVTVRSARDFRMRDLQQGNYVFVGSPGSNPWVSLFESRLNFIEADDWVRRTAKFFANRNPKPGEMKEYRGLPWTGTEGEDYASVAVLQNEPGKGKVMIIQGLQQEGTEAAGLFVANDLDRQRLVKALGDASPGSFEVLLRTKAAGGATNLTEIVATRVYP